MTTAWSWSLMREPWWKSTTLAATPQVRREQGSTAWGSQVLICGHCMELDALSEVSK